MWRGWKWGVENQGGKRQFILTLTFLEVVGVEMVGREPRVVRQFILTITFLEVMGVEACICCDIFETAQFPLLVDS